ncbi:MAG: hypothetical protein ACKO6C_05415 [Alphaproteobacteria bacterium]
MQQKKLPKKHVKKELEKIYNKDLKWARNGQSLNKNFNKTINDSPILKWILTLSILSNIGIWSALIMLNIK